MARTIATRAGARRAGYRPRAMRRRLALPLAVVLVLAPLGAPAALAQESPFQGLPAPPPTQPTAPQTQTTNGDDFLDDGFETWQGILVVLAGVTLISGIALAIIRHAREHAPAAETDAATAAADAHHGGRQAKAKRRQRSKAARAARRRNR